LTHSLLTELDFVAIVIVIVILDVLTWIFIRRKSKKTPRVFLLLKLGYLGSYVVIGFAADAVQLAPTEILFPALTAAVVVVYYVMFIQFPEPPS
jgi:hypothetical protein